MLAMLEIDLKIKKIIIVALFLLTITTSIWAEAKEPVVISMPKGSIGLDPAHAYLTTEAQLFTAIYEGLVSNHPISLEPIPAVASKWTISPDGKVYTFYLRKNGKYWNGETIIAEDFRNAWFRLLDPNENAEYSFLLDCIKGATEYRNGIITDKEQVGIKVIDYFTLEVTLKEPANYFLNVLCHHSFSPINELNLEDGKWRKGTSSLGNGPYIIYSQSQDHISLKKNIFYWDHENVAISDIKIVLSDNLQEVTNSFNNKETLWASSNIYYSEIEDRDSIVVNPLFGTTYFYFSTKNKPFNKHEIRRALCLMLPWDIIRSKKLFFLPSSTLVPSISGYPKVEGINKRDMQEALRLLHQAGYTQGKGIGTIKINIPNSQVKMLIASIMKQTWEKFLKLDVEIITTENDKYFDSLNKDDYTIGTTSWIGDFADPLAFLLMWTSNSNLNSTGNKNPEYDNIIRKSLIESDMKMRYSIMSKAEELLLNSGLVIPIENYPSFNAVNLDILQGWFPNALDLHPFKYFFIKEPEVPMGAG